MKAKNRKKTPTWGLGNTELCAAYQAKDTTRLRVLVQRFIECGGSLAEAAGRCRVSVEEFLAVYQEGTDSCAEKS